MMCLKIKMFGDFSIQVDDQIISDKDNRTKKIWSLLAYLICHRGRIITQKELIKLLWGDDPSSTNPENALRITFHRLRSQLDQLWPTAGKDLIISKESGYLWNDQYPLSIDIDQFERLCKTDTTDEDELLSSYFDAFKLYQGEFLEKQSSEAWVIPISTYFYNLFINISIQAATLLSQKNRYPEAIQICKNAIATDLYNEPLHQILIKNLAAMGNQKEATAVYETLCKQLFDNFGIRPSDETHQIYRSAVHTVNDNALSLDIVLEDLREKNEDVGALQCDYDYFKVLCFSRSRSMERSGKATHIVLLSVTDGALKPLSKQSLGRIMNQLGEQIRVNLRRGDVFSRCSASQYIIMLPEANYENSNMVSRRIIGAFSRRHPHVTAKINYVVQPLSSGISVP